MPSTVRSILGADGEYVANGNGMPWWVKAIGVVGIPGILALGFGYTLRGDVVTRLDASAAVQAAHNAQMAVDQHNNELRDVNLLFLFRQVCLNTADTATEREGCRLPLARDLERTR